MKILSINNWKWIYFVFILLVQSINITAEKNYSNLLVIKYVNFDIMTFSDVSCSDFESIFNDEIKTIKITDCENINEFYTILEKLKIDSEAESVDVRMRIQLYCHHCQELICLSRFQVSRGGKIYLMDDSFLLFLEKLISVGRSR